MKSREKNTTNSQICNKIQIQNMLSNSEIGVRMLGWDQNEITNRNPM
jgi:hypothetical protein